jgi:hypothetical protein
VIHRGALQEEKPLCNLASSQYATSLAEYEYSYSSCSFEETVLWSARTFCPGKGDEPLTSRNENKTNKCDNNKSYMRCTISYRWFLARAKAKIKAYESTFLITIIISIIVLKLII